VLQDDRVHEAAAGGDPGRISFRSASVIMAGVS
jgi:hypothetical protein